MRSRSSQHKWSRRSSQVALEQHLRVVLYVIQAPRRPIIDLCDPWCIVVYGKIHTRYHEKTCPINNVRDATPFVREALIPSPLALKMINLDALCVTAFDAIYTTAISAIDLASLFPDKTGHRFVILSPHSAFAGPGVVAGPPSPGPSVAVFTVTSAVAQYQ